MNDKDAEPLSARDEEYMRLIARAAAGFVPTSHVATLLRELDRVRAERDEARRALALMTSMRDSLRQYVAEVRAERPFGLASASTDDAAKELWADLVLLQSGPGTFTDEQRDVFCVGRIASAMHDTTAAARAERDEARRALAEIEQIARDVKALVDPRDPYASLHNIHTALCLAIERAALAKEGA